MRRNPPTVAALAFCVMAALSPLAAEQPQGAVTADSCIEERLTDFSKEMRAPEASLRVGVRILDDACGQTLQIVLVQTPDGQLSARAIVADHLKASERADQLLRQNPDLPRSRLCHELPLKSVSTAPSDLVKLRQLVQRLRGLRISPILEPLLVLHGSQYEIRVESGVSEAKFSFYGTEDTSSEDSPQRPLERWSQDLRSILGLQCHAPSK